LQLENSEGINANIAHDFAVVAQRDLRGVTGDGFIGTDGGSSIVGLTTVCGSGMFVAPELVFVPHEMQKPAPAGNWVPH